MKRSLRIASVFVLMSVILVVGYSLMNVRSILDYVALRNYTPPAEVSALADKTKMSEATRRVFYVNHPQLQQKPEFAKSCTQQEETIVLGCYVQNDGIYLLIVTDERLNGIVEVTAAHEVLHAMYDRLSSDERSRIDSLTAQAFANLDNQRIKDNVENYKKRDPSVVPTELHSILGTEVAVLPQELEEYYSKYFTDRQAVVALLSKYESTFVNLENQAKSYDARLKVLKSTLDDNEAQLGSLGKEIDVERSQLDSLLSSGRVSEYNAKVASFNALVNIYNALVKERQREVAEYNQLVEDFNTIAITEAELYDSLKSSPPPIEPQTRN